MDNDSNGTGLEVNNRAERDDEHHTIDFGTAHVHRKFVRPDEPSPFVYDHTLGACYHRVNLAPVFLSGGDTRWYYEFTIA